MPGTKQLWSAGFHDGSTLLSISRLSAYIITDRTAVNWCRHLLKASASGHCGKEITCGGLISGYLRLFVYADTTGADISFGGKCKRTLWKGNHLTVVDLSVLTCFYLFTQITWIDSHLDRLTPENLEVWQAISQGKWTQRSNQTNYHQVWQQ